LEQQGASLSIHAIFDSTTAYAIKHSKPSRTEKKLSVLAGSHVLIHKAMLRDARFVVSATVFK
jgi:hypothetical protein